MVSTMRQMSMSEFEAAMRQEWPRMMDAREIARFTSWTRLSVLNWIKDGQITGDVTVGDATRVLIPREVVFAQLDPRNHTRHTTSGD